jgi:hypothetical protein
MEKARGHRRRLLRASFVILGVACATTPEPAESPDAAARRVAAAMTARDIEALAAAAHPTKGIRFTPYTRVDTLEDRRLGADEMRAGWASADSTLWGSYDGSGAPIRLTFREYFDRFVRDFDVAAAPRVASDSAPMGTGNAINNVREAYPGAVVVEFHAPGTDPRYGGMDWRSLWIVLEKSGDRWYVVALVHGGWTI